MKKISAQFFFDKTYINSLGETKEAIVQLSIQYQTQTFSVTPLKTEKFCFMGVSHNFEKWKAVIAAINEAIDFAVMELGLVEKECTNNEVIVINRNIPGQPRN